MSVSDSASERYVQDPDVRLMLLVRDDNAAAFEELVSRYQARLRTILQHLVGSRDAAEDLAQEVFLRLFRTRKRYQPDAKFSTFLFTIAHNVASNARRTLARRREVQVYVREGLADGRSRGLATLEELAKEASGMMPTRQLDKLERAEVVRLAMQALNERQRLALLLCKFEGMSYAEIAHTMNLTPQAIKSLLSRARCNLRDVLEPYLSEGNLPAGNGDSKG